MCVFQGLSKKRRPLKSPSLASLDDAGEREEEEEEERGASSRLGSQLSLDSRRDGSLCLKKTCHALV